MRCEQCGRVFTGDDFSAPDYKSRDDTAVYPNIAPELPPTVMPASFPQSPTPAAPEKGKSSLSVTVIAVTAIIVIGAIAALAIVMYFGSKKPSEEQGGGQAAATSALLTEATAAAAQTAETTAPPVSAAAPPATAPVTAYSAPVAIGSHDQYDINIFLSNFSEIVPFYSSYGTTEDKMMFVMRHKFVNAFDIVFYDDVAFLSGKDMRNNLNYFFRFSVKDGTFGSVRYNREDDLYSAYSYIISSQGTLTYGEPHRFSVAENVIHVSGNSYQVDYSSYESQTPCNDSCYSMTPSAAASASWLEKIGSGKATLGVDNEGLYMK